MTHHKKHLTLLRCFFCLICRARTPYLGLPKKKLSEFFGKRRNQPKGEQLVEKKQLRFERLSFDAEPPMTHHKKHLTLLRCFFYLICKARTPIFRAPEKEA